MSNNNASAKSEKVVRLLGNTQAVDTVGIKRVEKIAGSVRQSAYQYENAQRFIRITYIPAMLMIIGGLLCIVFASRVGEPLDFIVRGLGVVALVAISCVMTGFVFMWVFSRKRYMSALKKACKVLGISADELDDLGETIV